jgi:hypothetical protein
VAWAGLGAALGPCRALRPVHAERGGVRRLGTDGAVENRGGAAVTAYRRKATVGARTKHTTNVFFYSRVLRGDNTGLRRGRAGGDGSVRR